MDLPLPKKSKMKPTKSKMKPTSSSERGVCYFSHVPHGFFEKEMREFLTQFGTVTNLRIGKYVIPLGTKKILVEFLAIVTIVLFLRSKRSIFQTFWKTDSCTDFLLLELETSNFGYMFIFLFPLTVQSFSKIGQH